MRDDEDDEGRGTLTKEAELVENEGGILGADNDDDDDDLVCLGDPERAMSKLSVSTLLCWYGCLEDERGSGRRVDSSLSASWELISSSKASQSWRLECFVCE